MLFISFLITRHSVVAVLVRKLNGLSRISLRRIGLYIFGGSGGGGKRMRRKEKERYIFIFFLVL